MQILQFSKNHPLNACRAIKHKYVMVGYRGNPISAGLGLGNSFATFFPEVIVLCASGSRDLLQALCHPSMTACQGPLSELDRVQNPRNWILKMGKLSHKQVAHVPATTPNTRSVHLTSQVPGTESCCETLSQA